APRHQVPLTGRDPPLAAFAQSERADTQCFHAREESRDTGPSHRDKKSPHRFLHRGKEPSHKARTRRVEELPHKSLTAPMSLLRERKWTTKELAAPRTTDGEMNPHARTTGTTKEATAPKDRRKHPPSENNPQTRGSRRKGWAPGAQNRAPARSAGSHQGALARGVHVVDQPIGARLLGREDAVAFDVAPDLQRAAAGV